MPSNWDRLQLSRCCFAVVVAFADVEDLDATRETLIAAGATDRSVPYEVAPDARVCVLADADGNSIGLRRR